MIQYVSDDIFASPAQTLVNTVNTVGVMGKGIAAEFKRRFPEMFVRYERHCRENTLTIGRLYLYRSPHKWVLNFPTKQHWRNSSRLEWVEAGLVKFVQTYEAQGITSVAFPQLGCGNGGLDWAVVKPLMDQHLRGLPISVFVHTRTRAPDFIPEHASRLPNKDLLLPRAPVPFSKFIADLMAVLGQPVPSNITDRLAADHAGILDEAEPLPPAPRVQSAEADFEISWSSLEILWGKLVRRGALSLRDFPELDRLEASALSERLRQLEYIQSMNFILGSFDAPRIEPGIRFAPLANVDGADLWVERATYADRP